AGPLLTLGGAIFWKPAGSTDPPAFLLPKKDAERVLLSTAFSASSPNQFHEILVAEPAAGDGVELADLFRDIIRHRKAARNDCPPVISGVLYAGIRYPALPSSGAEKTLAACGLCIDTTAAMASRDREALGTILCQDAGDNHDTGLFLYQYGLIFDSPPAFSTRDISRLVAATVAKEPCTDLVRLSPATRIHRAIIGISYLSGMENTEQMPIWINGECPGWNKTYETITRWLHPGCTDLELVPLTGGYSGTLVFRVSARDSRGRLTMPLVMKLGSWPLIEAEIRGYTDHVKRYIQNNATQIIETDRIGEYGGILYNFVGIGGAESRIYSLEDYYLSHAPDEILPVFDSLFNVVLKGWYAEPKRKEIALYQEYNRFWKYELIREYARTWFGATPDMEEIDLPFGLGRSVNPLWFVEKVMPGRMSQTLSVYESSVHCDLNMKNVLMDEKMNMWLIDFADTKYSHILRDIIKLEAVMKGEMVPVSSRQTLEELALLDARFLAVRSLTEIPDLPGSIGDPAMDKAFRVVLNLRRHANRITVDDHDITQYYLGLLPYTLNLLSYVSVNDYQKEYGWIASSLICRQLMNSSPR
ncbi:MAG: anti-anti-sigma factor, partial [Methanomicrobiales archaeon]|nr:anti-anti-sigma factor [Methanomicrobiales archaeon]